MEHFIKKQTLQAFKLNVRQMKHKKVQNGKAMDFHRKKLRSKSIQSWIAYLDIKDDKRRFQNQQERLADNFFLAKLMHKWLQVAKS